MKKDKPKFRQILDTALIVIKNQGFYHAKVNRIAIKADVTESIIYFNFKNEDDILISLFQEKMGKFVEKNRAKIAGINTALEKLFILIEKGKLYPLKEEMKWIY